MANWKKMAEAFGRAFMADNSTKAGRNLVRKTKMYEGLDGNVMPGQEFNPGNSPEGQAFQRGVGDAERIDRAAWDEGLDEKTNPKAAGDYKAKMREQLSDARLRNERFGRAENAYDKPFDNTKDEWDDAFKSAKEHVKRGYGDSYPDDMAGEGADTFEKQLWDVIDELKAQGRSVDDILGALKSMGQK